MAELDKQMFGNIKGKFGKAVFRQRHGKNYIAQKPSSYTAPMSEEFLKRTGKFKLSSKIAAAVNSVSVLKEIWRLNTPKGLSTYNYLISKNYTAVNGDSVSGILQIVPESKVGVRLNTLTLEADKLNLALLPLTSASLIDPNVEKKAQLVSLIFLSNPNSEDVAKFEVIPVLSLQTGVNLETALSFEIDFPTAVAEKIAKYQNKNIYSTLITFDENGKTVNYAGTFSYNVA